MHIPASPTTTEPTRHGNPKRVILRSGVLPEVTQVAEAFFNANDEVQPHQHPTMYEVYFVLEGRAVYEVGAEQYEVGPGDFIIVPPATQHRQRVVEAPHRVFYWGIAVDGTPAGG
jgi:quercetin dioxygenase-like cupin family protein